MASKPAGAASAKSAGTLQIWRPIGLESLELRIGTSFQHSYPRHWHEELFISAITAGAGNFHYRGSNHLATPGTLVLVAPGEVHAHHDCGGRSFRSIHIPSCLVAEVASEVTQRAGGLPSFPSSVIAHPRIHQTYLDLHRRLESHGSRLLRESLLFTFFAELIEHVSKESLHLPAVGRQCLAVQRAQEFLNEHYDQDVSLKDLAALSSLSPFHFHRVFCRQTGIPPHAYQIQVRIMRAKALLRKRWPIAHIASVTGFADQSHLTRHFRRLLGIPPAQYLGQSKNILDTLAVVDRTLEQPGRRCPATSLQEKA